MSNFAPMPEGVRLFMKTKDNVQKTWEKIKNYDKLFSDDVRWDEEWFFDRVFSEKTLMLETDGGVIFITDIVPNLYAAVHVSFWDHKLSARTQLLKDCMGWIFNYYNLARIEAMIPSFSRALKRFLVERLGFKEEGCMRNRLSYKGQLFDVVIYSILKEEV